MNAQKILRSKQRFENFSRALKQFEVGVKLSHPDEIQQQGIIQAFEYTFELGWKTMKDYLEGNDILVQFPRDVIKHAMQTNIITDGDTWLLALEMRNQSSHMYDPATAEKLLKLV